MSPLAAREVVDRLGELRDLARQYAADAAPHVAIPDQYNKRFWLTVADAADLAHSVLGGTERVEFETIAQRLTLALELRVDCGEDEPVVRTALQVVLAALRGDLKSMRGRRR
jgi:hypothetical protein